MNNNKYKNNYKKYKNRYLKCKNRYLKYKHNLSGGTILLNSYNNILAKHCFKYLTQLTESQQVTQLNGNQQVTQLTESQLIESQLTNANNVELNDLAEQSIKLLNEQYTNQVFGVFVTIKRNPIGIHNDVHGCIGYWTKDYTPMSSEQIVTHMLEVAYSAYHTDSRAQQFSNKNIYNEVCARVDVSLMLLPIYNVSSSGIIADLPTQQMFTNKDFGLIYDNPTNHTRATYLPEVFDESTSWEYLKKSLIKKSTNNYKDNYEDNLNNLYAYRIFRSDYSFFDTYTKIIIPIENFFDDAFTTLDTVPFSVTKRGNTLNLSTEINNQPLRNISTLYTIITKFPKIYTKYQQKIDNNIEYYLTRANEFDNQTLSFLLRLSVAYGQNNKTVYNKLHHALKTHSVVDIKFALGEILIAVIESDPTNSEDIMLEYMELYSNNYLKIIYNDVFAMNWYINFIDTVVTNYNITLDKEYTKELETIIMTLSNEQNSGSETNYLAVTYELLSSWISINDQIVYESVIDERCRILNILYHRRSVGDLFTFTDQQTARVDISVHVIDGIYK
jgi:hypothetical protein